VDVRGPLAQGIKDDAASAADDTQCSGSTIWQLDRCSAAIV
jgi:hypothetical protein